MTNPGQGGGRNVSPTKLAQIAYPFTQEFLLERHGKLLRAEWGPRCVALLVDFLGFSLPFNLLGQLIWIQRSLGELKDGGSSDSVTVIGIPSDLHNLLWFLLFGLYAALSTKRWGATLGKRWMNLEVLNADGNGAPSFLHLYGRYTIGYLLSAIWFMGGFIMAVFDKEKQTLHDKIFKTMVVLTDPIKLDRWF